ncbi:bifunctional riboflavin kinase/FAD synthetase [Magnetospirillum moscoviense]|uniref:Riboflavin biosynthesis protein n=1 Tax=Magnetospirillum moscoviense TaxID=1437059 RepID=A0A178MXG0_9PROT|nr:bifunctional riboflavin kinase/FAD synthetase [Magnetospirillum moscoviense]MBF0326078.1 bifunctional riboflavin kinase/FAD synthetase [Alphaproteobacteria bacterium]OAN54176.1 riboflavin biosynthesis protein RibF [Magnetospirillum moscoviense]
MRLIRHCGELTSDLSGAVVALGNFDGVHRGHQAVILAAKRIATELGAPHGVMTFEPHPRAFFNPAQASFRLTPFRVKSRLIEALGIDLLFQQHFDADFANLSAQAFIDDILGHCLNVRHVVVGYDYVFGKGRQGTGALLQKMADEGRFGFTSVPPEVAPSGETYSSTAVRTHLVEARPTDAARLLGHYWEIEGRVEHGDARGRTIGFPTANLHLGEYQPPAAGVYSVRAGIDKGATTLWRDGIANFGRRPTVDGGPPVLEVHLFDHSEDLYGRHLRVALIDFIRPERRFDGLDSLKAQIAADALQARAMLALRHFPESPGPLVPVAEP